MPRCTECGQMVSADTEGEQCSRCERAQEADELEEEVNQLRETLKRELQKSQTYDNIGSLIQMGCTPAQALDAAMVEMGSWDAVDWADWRSVGPSAVYNNISDEKEIYEPQTQLEDFCVEDAVDEEVSRDE